MPDTAPTLADDDRISLIIAVDFDGTCVDHRYPAIGDDVPHAVESLHEIVRRGHTLVLHTMRGEMTSDGDTLSSALAWFDRHGIRVTDHKRWNRKVVWTDSPKCYAHHYIDDAAVGCPLCENPRHGGRPYVDWRKVMEILFGERS